MGEFLISLKNDTTNVIQLQTEGGIISFYLYKILPNSVLYAIAIDMDKRLKCFSIQSNKMRISFSDISRFTSYLKETALVKDHIVQAEIFVPQELDFQFTVLDGEILSLSKCSYCSISFMINLSSCSEGFSNTYLGIESVVLINKIKEFYNDFKELTNIMRQLM